jgi:hypothetical protein
LLGVREKFPAAHQHADPIGQQDRIVGERFVKRDAIHVDQSRVRQQADLAGRRPQGANALFVAFRSRRRV